MTVVVPNAARHLMSVACTLAREPPGSWEVIPVTDMRKGSIFDTLRKRFLQRYTYAPPVASRPESKIGEISAQ